jgi:hypothetical protein
LASDGRQLECLVRQIEEFLLPAGCSVEARQRRYIEGGVPLAEFDLVIRGRFGSTNIVWLIECRDRPKAGPAPAEWIEQLIGRRQTHGFSRVTAVSSTGFSDGAKAIGSSGDIELRSVSAVSAEAISNWLRFAEVNIEKRLAKSLGGSVFVDPRESRDRINAALSTLQASKGEAQVLLIPEVGKRLCFAEAFQRAVDARGNMFDSVIPNHPTGRRVEFRTNYPNADGRLIVETTRGQVEVQGVRYTGRLLVNLMPVALGTVREYKRDQSGAIIAQIAEFPVQLKAGQFSLDLHRFAETGEVRAVARKINDGKAQSEPS